MTNAKLYQSIVSLVFGIDRVGCDRSHADVVSLTIYSESFSDDAPELNPFWVKGGE